MNSHDEDVRPESEDERVAKIRVLNDQLRTGVGQGDLFVTPGIIDLGNGAVVEILMLVRHFDQFDEGNDPYGEHDFGAVTYRGEQVLWKIDYYDTSLMFGSDDPANAAITRRVLTVMLAREY